MNKNGLTYFIQGIKIMMMPGLKRFVLLPILVNIIVIGTAFTWLFTQFSGWINMIMSYVPSWLNWLSYLLWPVLIILTLLFFGYFFGTLANIIASPFNGLLSEKVEEILTGNKLEDGSWAEFAKDVPRMIKRELSRLGYYLPRALLLFVLFFIPLIGQIIAPILWFIFGAWMMAIQYCDYPFDNHKISFNTMKAQLYKDKACSVSFGAIISVCTMIPLINLVVMPISVCGATAMWVDRYHDKN